MKQAVFVLPVFVAPTIPDLNGLVPPIQAKFGQANWNKPQNLGYPQFYGNSNEKREK